MGPNYQVKASVFRAYVKWLDHHGKLAAVLPRLAPRSARLVEEPPLTSTWMASQPLDDLVEQIEVLDGLEGVKRAAADILRDQMGPLLLPMARNVLRILGPSPATVFQRWGDLLKTTMRGVDWEWTSTGPDSGQLVMTYTHGRSVSLRSYFSTLPALELGLSLSGKSGTVGEPELLSDQSARFVVRWKG